MREASCPATGLRRLLPVCSSPGQLRKLLRRHIPADRLAGNCPANDKGSGRSPSSRPLPLSGITSAGWLFSVLNPRDIRTKQTKQFPFEGAAVSEVALAESLIDARAVASQANGPFSGSTEVLLLRYFLRGTSIQCEGNSGPLVFACAVVKAELKWKRQDKVSARSYADDRNNSCTWISGRRTAASC
jgi:hypothetical protein